MPLIHLNHTDIYTYPNISIAVRMGESLHTRFKEATWMPNIFILFTYVYHIKIRVHVKEKVGHIKIRVGQK